MSAAHDLANKLKRLRQDCARLETHRELSLEEFLGSSTIQEETCYLLFTACQSALDIAAELLQTGGKPRPGDGDDVFAQLGAEEIVSENCVSQLIAMQGLCTSISQQYEDIDPQWVYQALQVNLAGLNQFAQQVQTYLDQ
jgi:uncharacterized protein YutE (UPF0331/DUF86 family)